MRIAFLSNEFIIEKPDAGGLGNYLHRITQALVRQGHEVELFVTKFQNETPDVQVVEGVTIHHVQMLRNHRYHYLRKLDKLFLKSPWFALSEYYGIAASLSQKLEERHEVAPFDFVQSTNCAASGLFVKSKRGRLHVVRLSSIRELGISTDGLTKNLGSRLLIRLENRAIKKADLAYATCHFTANYLKTKGNLKLEIIRPPFYSDSSGADIAHLNLPVRYMVHFGSIGPVKGSDLLAEALLLVWDKVPDFKMVWAGKERKEGEMKKYRSLWGERAKNIIWFQGLIKQELNPVVAGAEASVLPSRIDNLPNTVIESLSMSIPVIAFKGASIDEIVEHRKNGLLVEMGNVKALADALLEAWNNPGKWLPDGFQRPVILDEMQPDIAAQNLINAVIKFKSESPKK